MSAAFASAFLSHSLSIGLANAAADDSASKSDYMQSARVAFLQSAQSTANRCDLICFNSRPEPSRSGKITEIRGFSLTVFGCGTRMHVRLRASQRLLLYRKPLCHLLLERLNA